MSKLRESAEILTKCVGVSVPGEVAVDPLDVRIIARSWLSKPADTELHQQAEQLTALSSQRDELATSLSLMTSLCRLKYGNLNKDVYAEIEKAESLVAKLKGVPK